MAQQKTREQLLAEMRARRTQPTSPTSEVGGDDRLVPESVRNILAGGSLLGLIPTMPTKALGAASSLGLAGIEGIEAARSAGRGEWDEAALNAFFAALGVGGTGAFLRSLRRAIPAAAPAITSLEERAAKIRTLQAAINKAKEPTREQVTSLASEQRKLAAEARRVFREQRLTARELRLEGKAVPKELQAAIKRAASASEAVGKRLAPPAPVVEQPARAAVENTKKVLKKKAEAVAKLSPEAQKMEAALSGLMRKLNLPEEAVDEMRTIITKKASKKVSKRQRKAMDELGMSAAELMTRVSSAMAGAAAGGVAGASARPEDAERSQLAYALAGAGMGAMAGGGLSALALAGGKSERIKLLTDFNYFSLLSAPGAVGKATLGSLSSVVVGSIIRAGEGRFADAARILKTAMADSSKGVYFKALKNPIKYIPVSVQQKSRIPLRPGMLGVPTRVIAAADAVSSRALMAGGFSRADALRLNLSGDPQTAAGRWLLRAFGLPATKILPSGRKVTQKPLTSDETAQLAMRFFLPFARVAVAIPERMVEFSPATLLSPTLRSAFQHGSRAETVTKAILGPTAGVLGGAAGQEFTPDVDPLISATAGPLAGWAELGMRVARGAGRDRPAISALNEAVQNLPLIAEQFSALSPLERLVPSAFRDVARAIDPAFQRERGPASVAEARLRSGKGGGFLGETLDTILAPVKARIPVLRESLPERAMPVDVWGRPLYPARPKFIPDITLRGFGKEVEIVDIETGRPRVTTRPGPLAPGVMPTAPTMFTSTPLSNPPVFPLNDPTAQTIRGIQRRTMPLGEILNPPSVVEPDVASTLRLAGRDVGNIPRDIKLLGQRARGAPLEVTLRQVVQSPTFQSMPDDLKNIMLRRVISSVRDETGPPVSELTAASVVAPSSQDAIRASLRRMIAGFGGQ